MQALEGLSKNVEVVETQTGKYRIIYENHSFPAGVDKLGNNYAALVLEGVIQPEDSRTALEWAQRERTPEEVEKTKQWRQTQVILEQMGKEGKPMFNVDAHGGVVHGFAQLYGVPVAEWLVASKVFGRARKQSKDEMTRRQFFARAGAGLAEVYLKGDAVLRMFSSVAPFGGWFAPGKISENLYPQSSNYVLTLRNLIAAEKMEKLYSDNKEQFDGKELVAVYGAWHTGLAEALKMGSEERLKRIQEILNLLHTLPTPIRPPDSIGLVIRLDFDKSLDAWHITQAFEDPDIRKVIDAVGK
jgi:hypothetical protein